MKVLFLDIDGVCNSRQYALAQGPGMGMIGIDQKAAAMVRTIVERTGCVIVLSSTWRLHKDLRDRVIKEVCSIEDCTPHLKGGFRGDEVKQWLTYHPEVTRYAILDDDSDFHTDQPLFKTTFEHGLTVRIMQDVINYLNQED